MTKAQLNITELLASLTIDINAMLADGNPHLIDPQVKVKLINGNVIIFVDTDNYDTVRMEDAIHEAIADYPQFIGIVDEEWVDEIEGDYVLQRA